MICCRGGGDVLRLCWVERDKEKEYLYRESIGKAVVAVVPLCPSKHKSVKGKRCGHNLKYAEMQRTA